MILVIETEALNQKTVDFILSDIGRAAASELTKIQLSERETLSLLSQLRRNHSAAEAGALLALAKLRRRAATKFPKADRLFFTAEALEQATAWEIAEYRARWFDTHAPSGAILDLGCGIGGDTLALAQRRAVIAYETDPVRLRFAEENAAVLGLAHRCDFRLADWRVDFEAGTLPMAAAVFADPARRVASAKGGKRRVFQLDQMEPPIDILLRLQQQIPALGVKVMPGVADEQLPKGCDVEFVSHGGSCKEAILWFGALRKRLGVVENTPFQGESDVHRRAAFFIRKPSWPNGRISGGEWLSIDASGVQPPVGEVLPGHILHEPDPALIRAGAFAELCDTLDGHLFDPMIAYIVTKRHDAHLLTQSFLVREVHRMSLTQLNRRLLALGIGRVELKKRGVPLEPEELRRRLKLKRGGEDAVIIFTRRGDERLMLITRRVSGKN